MSTSRRSSGGAVNGMWPHPNVRSGPSLRLGCAAQNGCCSDGLLCVSHVSHYDRAKRVRVLFRFLKFGPVAPHSSQGDTALPESPVRWWVGLERAPMDFGGLSSPHPQAWAVTDTCSCRVGCFPGGRLRPAGGDFTSQDSLQSSRETMKGLDMGVLA